MKKVLLVLLFLIGFSFSAIAQQKYLSCIKNGEYAYFLDSRYDKPYARGYFVLHYDENTTLFFSNVVDIEAGTRKRIVFSTTLDEKGGINIKSINMPEGVSKDEEPLLLQNAIDLLNYASMRFVSTDEIDVDSTLEDPWNESFSLWYHFSSAYPFLSFDKISYDKEHSNNGISVYCYGRYTNPDKELLEEFYEYEIKPFEEVERNSGSVPPKAKKMNVTSNGYKIALDENWTKNEFEGNDSYWLNIQSFRESQIMIENPENIISLKSKEEKLAFVKMIIPAIKNLIPTSINVKFEKNDLIIEYLSYDEQNWVTYSRMRITDDAIINFSSFKDVYETNTKYFETILKSIKK